MVIFVDTTPELGKSKDNSKEIEDATESLKKQLFIEKTLKTQAVNKLAEIMCRKDFLLRENSKKRKATSDDLRKKEKECRRLHQELGAVSWPVSWLYGFWNRPFRGCLLPLCQNKSSFKKNIHMEICSACRIIIFHANQTQSHFHMKEGGTFGKKLRCCVGGSITR